MCCRLRALNNDWNWLFFSLMAKFLRFSNNKLPVQKQWLFALVKFSVKLALCKIGNLNRLMFNTWNLQRMQSPSFPASPCFFLFSGTNFDLLEVFQRKQEMIITYFCFSISSMLPFWIFMTMVAQLSHTKELWFLTVAATMRHHKNSKWWCVANLEAKNGLYSNPIFWTLKSFHKLKKIRII